jgi:signal transduction histidine kinase/HAMP domain-containing protein
MLSLPRRLIFGLTLLLLLTAGVGIFAGAALSNSAALDHGHLTREAAMATRDILAHHVRTTAAIIILVSFFVAGATAFLVLQPLRAAAAAARSIGQGNLDHRIEWSYRDELGTIATEVNRMAIRLRDLRETEQGRRQMELQLSDAIVQSIFEPIIVTDARGQVLKINQAATAILGDAAGDRMALTNTPGGDRILAAVRDAVSMQRPHLSNSLSRPPGDAPMNGQLTTIPEQERENAILPLRIGNADRCYRLRTTPMRDADGKLLGAVSVLEDMTELQDLDRFKSRFISVASEKLRGPLESARLGLYALVRGFAGEMRPLQMDLMEGVQQSIENLTDLMADLIDVAEIDSGRRELRLERLRPIDVLRDASNRHRDAARKEQIDVQINAFADLSPILADRRAMRSVMDNLIVNALRYTPAGGSILLEAEESTDRIQFFVRDTGRGIATERLPRIFGRFQGGSGDGKGEGTGLGLALVRRLIEAQGGQVSIESKIGLGTTVSFILPIAVPAMSRHMIEVG